MMNYLRLLLAAHVLGVLGLCGCGGAWVSGPRPIPVILDTDIGGDIDDMWALSFLLASPEFDIQLVVSESNDTVAKARLLAEFLRTAGRDDIPIGIGIKPDGTVALPGEWDRDYRGTVHLDGVQAIIDTLMRSERQMTLLAVGPVGNLEEALTRQLQITDKARLVVMGGCIGTQEQGGPGFAEYNVRKNIKAAQKVYGADWDVTMAPVDSAGKAVLQGDDYIKVRDADTPMVRMLMEHYRIWNQNNPKHARDIRRSSSILWDTVAVYLAFDERFCRMRDIPLRVTDEGFTQPVPDGKMTHVATGWKDIDGFFGLLSDRIATYTPPVTEKASP